MAAVIEQGKRVTTMLPYNLVVDPRPAKPPKAPHVVKHSYPAQRATADERWQAVSEYDVLVATKKIHVGRGRLPSGVTNSPLRRLETKYNYTQYNIIRRCGRPRSRSCSGSSRAREPTTTRSGESPRLEQ